MFIKVDLPEPEAPMMATISPASMRRFTPLSTATVPSPDGNSRHRSWTSSKAGWAVPVVCVVFMASEHPRHASGAGAACAIGAPLTRHHLLAGLQPCKHLGLHAVVQADLDVARVHLLVLAFAFEHPHLVRPGLAIALPQRRRRDHQGLIGPGDRKSVGEGKR